MNFDIHGERHEGKSKVVAEVMQGTNQSRNRLDLIHSDVWELTQNVIIGVSRYFISFSNDFTRHTWIYLIEKKREVFSCFRDLKNLVERETGRKIKCLDWMVEKSTFLASS